MDRRAKNMVKAMKILEQPPSLDDYLALYHSTGWDQREPVSVEQLQAALDRSWLWVQAVVDGRVMGVGRVVSEGTLYAFVVDLIVLPEHQGRGIGGALLERIGRRCREAGMRRVWLFAAEGKAGFYERHGYQARGPSEPGMQLMG